MTNANENKKTDKKVKFYLCENCGWVMRSDVDDEYKCYEEADGEIIADSCTKDHLKEIDQQTYNEMLANEADADFCDNMGIIR